MASAKIDIGNDIRAFCSKCKAETVHVITKIAGGVVKKVFCKSCASTHIYKDAKAAAKSPAGNRSASGTGARRSFGARWSTLMGDIEDSEVIDYQIDKDLSGVEAIRHKKFGIGVITKVLDGNKIEVLFRDEKKVLVHKWE